MIIQPITLENEYVKLISLSLDHKQGICEAIEDGELWRLAVTTVPHPKDIDVFFDQAFDELDRQVSLPFTIIDKQSDKIAGSTRFRCLDVTHRHAEIGFTFLGKQWQGIGLNKHIKQLMLSHAFETWQCIRVSFITDVLNKASRKAIEKLGAKQEGIILKTAVESRF